MFNWPFALNPAYPLAASLFATFSGVYPSSAGTFTLLALSTYSLLATSVAFCGSGTLGVEEKLLIPAMASLPVLCTTN